MPKLKISPPPFPNREEYPFTASIRYRGMVIDVENLDGSVREGTDPNGKSWRTSFKGCHYGELRGSLGTDGDKLDVYIKSTPNDKANKAYIVHQNFPRTHPTKGGKYDEDKVVLGVASLKEARELYLKHYNRKDFLRSITEMPIEKFKRAAFGENKGEKVAHWSAKSIAAYDNEVAAARTRGEPTLADLENALAASSFIRQKMKEGEAPMTTIEKIKEATCKTPGEKKRSKGKGRGEARGDGKGPRGVPVGEKKSEVTEAYKLGAQTAMDEYLKEAAQKGFQSVLKKLPGSPPVMGAIPAPPRVPAVVGVKTAQGGAQALGLNPGMGMAPMGGRNLGSTQRTQMVAGQQSAPDFAGRIAGSNVASPKTTELPAQQQQAPAVKAQPRPAVASSGGAGGVPQIPTGV